MLLGREVEKMSEPELADAAEKATLFARLLPPTSSGSSRLCRARATSSDSWATASTTRPRLQAADVGISVDTAVDIAKESADMILLEKA